jgi:single-stranded DNA-binding protein
MKTYNVSITVIDTDNWRDSKQEQMQLPAEMISFVHWDQLVQIVLQELLKKQAAKQTGEAEDE